jgi:hypothetical protein
MMRFRGGGVGHKTTREATDSFKGDRDPLDDQATCMVGFNDSESEVDEAETIIDGEIQVEEDTEIQDEEEDYGYTREDSESETDESETHDDDAELGVDEVYFGPEDDGGAIDPDMDALGYAEM